MAQSVERERNMLRESFYLRRLLFAFALPATKYFRHPRSVRRDVVPASGERLSEAHFGNYAHRGQGEVAMSDSEKEPEGTSDSSKRMLPRREWLTGFAAGGVVTAGAAIGYDSCEVSPRVSDSAELELKYIKAAVEPLRDGDHVAEGKRQGLLSDEIQGELAGDVNEYLSTTYQALVYSELVNGLPETLRSGEEVQSDIASMSPVLDQAVADAYYVIGMADDDVKALLDREVRDNPDVLMDMASGLDKDGARHGMGIRGRLRLRRASRQLSSRLRMQSANEVIAELTDQLTKVSERNTARSDVDSGLEVSSAAKRMWAAYQEPVRGVEKWHPEAYADPMQPEPAPEPEPAAGDLGSAEKKAFDDLERQQRGSLARLEQKEQALTRASRGLAGAGAGLLIGGGIGFAVSGGVGGMVAMCIGGFLLLIALFVLAARTRRRKELEDEQGRLKSTGDQ